MAEGRVEPISEVLCGVMEAGADGADGDAEDFGDLFVGQLVVEFEEECLALRIGQGGDGSAERFEAGVFGDEGGCGRFGGKLLGGPMRAHGVEAHVARDAEEVGAGRSRGAEPLDPVEGADESVLQQILGAAGERALAAEIAEQRGGEVAVEGFELCDSVVHSPEPPCGQERWLTEKSYEAAQKFKKERTGIALVREGRAAGIKGNAVERAKPSASTSGRGDRVMAGLGGARLGLSSRQSHCIDRQHPQAEREPHHYYHRPPQ